jgi:hypothetical protein
VVEPSSELGDVDLLVLHDRNAFFMVCKGSFDTRRCSSPRKYDMLNDTSIEANQDGFATVRHSERYWAERSSF